MIRTTRTLLSVALALVFSLATVALASAEVEMRTVQLGDELCKTEGGGDLVPVPGSPEEQIDERLVRDLRWIKRRFDTRVTKGYSADAPTGDHPLGLAVNIVPNPAKGGTWKKIDRLAKWAEPAQNQPRAPFSWVAYDGDLGHGRGALLHLSWQHSAEAPPEPAEVVYSMRCPV